MSAPTVLPPRRRRVVAGAFTIALFAVAACSTSAAPLVDRVESAPLPDGAVEMSREVTDGSFDMGPSAELEYSLDSPLKAVCPELLSLYLADGYTMEEYVSKAAITDPDTWCAQQISVATSDDSLYTLVLIVVVFPPGVDTGYSVDGFSVVLRRAAVGDVHPKGTHLSLSSP